MLMEVVAQHYPKISESSPHIYIYINETYYVGSLLEKKKSFICFKISSPGLLYEAIVYLSHRQPAK